MTQQYLRKCSLIIGNQAGDGIELSDLHVKFSVHRSDTQTPAHASIRVYNMSDDTAKIIQQEYTRLFLQAGYDGNFGLLFKGSVRQFKKGRESATDTYLDILAQDGDVGYNFAVTNTTLSAGWNQQALHEAVVRAFSEFDDIAAGYTPVFGGPAMPRGKVCYGMARDYMRTLAEGAGTSWHVADGLLNMVPIQGALPGEAVVLTSHTGLIGLPQQTIAGVAVKCLINPQIKQGGVIKLDNASIQQLSFNIAYQPGSSNNVFNQTGLGDQPVSNTGLDADGLYKVYSIEMVGDTRGNEWYFNLICAGVNATAPISGPYVNATASSTGF